MHHSTLLTSAAVAALLPVSAFAAFSDVPASHPHAEAIAYVQAEGIVSGNPDGTYKPDATINRAELTKIVMEAVGYRDAEGSCFPDVGTEWFATYVCAAKVAGVVGGYPDGSFKPEASVTFVEAAKIIAAAYALDLPSVGGPWYAQYVVSLEGSAAIPRDIKAFDQPLTRGQMAEIIYRLQAGIADMPTMTYAELSGERAVASSKAASSRAVSSKAVSKAAADGGYPVSLAISESWQTDWDLHEIEGTPESLTNVTAEHEDGAGPGDYLRVNLPKGSGNRYIWKFFEKPLGGVYAWVDPEVTPVREMRFRYWVRFSKDFDFHKGGSLPGIFTGITNGRDEESAGAVNLGWEKEGKMAVYGRFSDKDQRVSNWLPGADSFKADGQWHKIDMHVTLNTEANRPNGMIEVWHDGVKVAGAESVMFPSRLGDMWDGLTLVASMGTMDLSSTSPKDQYVDLGGFMFSDKRLP